MDTKTAKLFSPLALRNIELPNRIIRSATFEGMGDSSGMPLAELSTLYQELARGGTGTIITGFVFISQAGRAMHPGQCGIDSDEKTNAWKNIVVKTKGADTSIKLIMQLAHTGRQTREEITGMSLVGASSLKCSYFKQKVRALDDEGILKIAREFGLAAYRAKQAGFDGVQIHAAHGYLIHQFLSPNTNTRSDRWSDRPLFLEEVIHQVRAQCGDEFPIFVKLSVGEDNPDGIRIADTIKTVKRLENLSIDAVEISYGTMEYTLNIIRGSVPLDVILNVNPFFNRIPRPIRSIWKTFFAEKYLKHIIPFDEGYNVDDAASIKRNTHIPIIPVGGIRSLENIADCINARGLDAVSLCRPLICEPDFPNRIRNNRQEKSSCTQCNLCTVNVDGNRPLQCYTGKERKS